MEYDHYDSIYEKYKIDDAGFCQCKKKYFIWYLFNNGYIF